jgi:hypothetical protein
MLLTVYNETGSQPVPVSKNRRKQSKSGKRRKATSKPQRASGIAAATEADFEARLSAVLAQALHFIPPGSIRHQRRFSVRLGHKDLQIDGSAGEVAFGRLDILLVHQDRPLAVLELKRPGLSLDDDDRRQGLSYARLLEPMAPLTIVSNGTQTQVFQTYNGAEWKPENPDASALEQLIRNAAQIGVQDIQNAIATLLGPRSGTARDILRSLSAEVIGQLTGDWDVALLPFAEGLSFPRKAPFMIAHRLDHGGRFILLSGPPLAGKSNVLQQLQGLYATRDDAVVWFVSAGSTRQGFFRLLADTFATELGWNIREDDARDWLRSVSHTGPFRLILAIDDPDPAVMGAEIDALASNAFGSRIQLILSCSTGVVASFIKTNNGRQYTPLGRAADHLELGSLDDQEFHRALKVLHDLRIDFMEGADRSVEYRNPWVLRSIAADIKDHPNHTDETISAGIPSLPGIQLMEFAERRLQDQELIRDTYVAFALAVLDDIASPDTAFATGLLSAFICRRATLSRHLSDVAFQQAVSRGELKPDLLPGDVRVVVAQVPEFAALTISRQLATRLLVGVDDHAARNVGSLVNACSRMGVLGDVIGAHALMEAAQERGGLPLSALTALLDRPPRKENFAPGSRLRVIMGDRFADLEVGEGGELYVIAPSGERKSLEADMDGSENMTADLTPWQMLSYFAAMPIKVVKDQATTLGWIDAHILETIAACPMLLRTPASGSESVSTHRIADGVVVCHKQGIVEPITLSLFYAAARDRRRGEYLTDAALTNGSAAFLMRMYIALRKVAELVDEERSQWAASSAERLLDLIKGKHLFH